MVLILLAVCGAGAGICAFAPVARAAEAADVVAKADVTGVEETASASTATGTGTVSVSLVKADLRAVVTALARSNGINLVGSDKLTGSVTLHLTDAPVLQALVVILKNAGFVLVKKDNGIYEISTEAELLKAGGAVTVKIFTLKFAEVAKVAKLLVPNAVPEAASIAENPEANQLIISATADQLRKVAMILKAVDTPKLQVAIQARIVEIFTDRAKSVGTELTLTKEGGALGDSGVGTVSIDLTQSPMQASTIDIGFVSDRLDAAISALTQKDVAEVLSAPRVTTGHGHKAEIKVVNNEPVITRTTRVVDSVTVTDETVTFEETGVTLIVTPRVLSAGKIEMVVEPSVKELTGTTDTNPPVPIISDRSAKTQVVISDGQWLVIGGLMRHSERERVRGVPLLMDIPYLGWFFKTKSTVREKSNLVFFVSATVLNDKKAKQDADTEKAAILKHREDHGLEGGPFPKPESKAPAEQPEQKK